MQITKSMIKAVRDAETFYANDDVDRIGICHAALENRAFNKWWQKNDGLNDEALHRFVMRLKKAVWKK